MHWYTDVIRRYAEFDGRSGRPEFWWFALWNIVITVVLFIVGAAVSSSHGALLVDLYGLLVLLPSLGVEIRRLHDTDRSGWWVLLAIVPIVGTIVLIVFFASAGTPGPNRYGAEPSSGPAVA